MGGIEEIKEEDDSAMSDSLKTDTELALEDSSRVDDSQGNGDFVGSPRDSQPSA